MSRAKGKRSKPGKRRGGKRKQEQRWRSPRRPLRLMPQDERLILDLFARRAKYEAAAAATEIGKRAVGLCNRGVELTERNSRNAAHELFLQASELFDADDLSAAAAWVWHCLAESYRDLPTGVRKENLCQAYVIYTRALASPERREDLWRYAMSQDGLSRCLRDFADEFPDGEARQKLYEEAYELQVEACHTAVNAGIFGWSWAIQHLTNLGNLCDRMGDRDRAIDVYEECYRHVQAVECSSVPELHDITREKLDWAKGNALCYIISARLGRFRADDRKRIVSCLDEARAIEQPPFDSVAHLLHARLLLRRGNQGNERIAAELAQVVPEQVMNSGYDRLLIDTLIATGERQRAAEVLIELANRSLDRRSTALANHVSDHWSEEAQQYSVQAAYLHADDGDAVGAFLALELTSGNRYFDHVADYAWRPRDAITHYLHEEMQQYGAMAAMLEDLAGWYVAFDGRATEMLKTLPSRHDTVDALLAESSGLRDALLPDEIERMCAQSAEMRDILERADAASVPSELLRHEAARMVREHERRRALCRARDPDFEASNKPWTRRISAEVLAMVAREHVECAFVRIHLLEELLIATVWWDGGGLTGRVTRCQVPGGYSALKQALDGAKEQPRALTGLLSQIDLSAALPPMHMAHGVLLPSLLASHLPLAALGPCGETLLDRFDALSWLPTLTPLYMRQAPWRPRRGTLTVAPGGTNGASVALRKRFPDETILRNDEATLGAVFQHASDADVVSFYTHGYDGSQAPENGDPGLSGPWIALARQDRLSGNMLMARHWVGMERVEIWACESGVDMPLDPRTDLVDEGFGFDVMFHHWGVRSTIATLWKVPDLITAFIVNHYRGCLIEGMNAPHALACAQRWWRDHGQSRLRELMREHGHDGVSRFVAELGVSATVEGMDAELASLLGPGDTGAERDQQWEWLASPHAWAGLRFLGVCERRPSEPYEADAERPLSDQERAEVAELLAASERTPDSARDSLEALAEELPDGQIPPPAMALDKAREFRARLAGAARYNLLRGLAWLHEAMQAPALSVSGWTELAIEATWMWLDLARGETITVLELVVRSEPLALLQRIERLLSEIELRDALVVPIERVAIELWADLLRNSGSAESQFDAFAEAQQRAAALAAEVDPNSWRSLRALAALMDLVALATEVKVEVAEALLAPVDQVDDIRVLPIEISSRLAWAADALCRRAGLPACERLPSQRINTHQLLARDWLTDMAHRARSMSRPEPVSPAAALYTGLKRDRNQDLDLLDACFWGFPDSDQADFWRSTGTPGAAHRAAALGYIESYVRHGQGAKRATETLWALQRLSDLRLPRLFLWARLFGWPNADANAPVMELARYFWHMVRQREMLLDGLDDAARVPNIAGVSSTPLVPWGISHSDPFVTSSADIFAGPMSGESNELDITAWYLTHCAQSGPEFATDTVTAAFHVARKLDGLEHEVLEMWRAHHHGLQQVDVARLRDDAPQLQTLAEPYIDSDVIEQMIRDLPQGQMLIGLASTPSGSLLGTAVMKASGRLIRRAHVVDAVAPVLRAALAMLEGTWPEDGELDRGNSSPRSQRWTAVRDALEPMLDALLMDDLPSSTEVMILAPGALRSLPWAGLHVRGRPLYRAVRAIRLLPAIGFLHHLSLTPLRAGKHACWLAESEPYELQGESRFGAAAIATLRAWYPPDLIVEREAPLRGRDIVEVDVIEPVAHELASLRIYGVGASTAGLNPSCAALALRARRSFWQHNLSNTFLPRCGAVELWAATGRSALASVARDDDRDRIPGLVWPLLASGAAGVLDLAWPVHDVVKALVCERFGLLSRSCSLLASHALIAALAAVASDLDVWRSTLGGFESVTDALRSLDDLRRHAARTHGVRPKVVRPFEALSDLPCVSMGSAAELVDEVCQPVHLAAFRCWGA